MSTKYKEYCSTAPEYTAEEAGELVVSMLEVERQMASPTPYDNQDEIALQQDYDHLKLDYAIALAAYNSFDPDDPLVVTHGHALQEADETLATFAAPIQRLFWPQPICMARSPLLQSQRQPLTQPLPLSRPGHQHRRSYRSPCQSLNLLASRRSTPAVTPQESLLRGYPLASSWGRED